MIGSGPSCGSGRPRAAGSSSTLPDELADDIRARTDDGLRRGFGSVRVEATVGGSTWRTSVFPDTSSGSFVLPVKKPVRIAEGIEPGDTVDVSLVVEP